MEFWSTIVRLLRRPMVTIPALLAAVGLGALTYMGTGATYVSSTTMVLAMTEYGGTQTEDPTAPTQLTNPLLTFNGSLQTTSAILIETMATVDVREQLGLTGGGTTQLIVNDGRTNPGLLGLSGPFLYIEGRSSSADQASRVVVEAQKLMRQKLSAWQRALHAPQKTYLTLVDVVSPTVPQAESGRGVKRGVLSFLCGFVLWVGCAYFVHQIRARRRARAAAVPTGPISRGPDEVEVPDRLLSPGSSIHGPQGPEGDPSPDAGLTPTSFKARAVPTHPLTHSIDDAEPAFTSTSPTRSARHDALDNEKEAQAVLVSVPRKVNGRSRKR